MLINEIWPENMPNGKYYIVREIQIGSVFFRMKEQAFSVYSKLSWCHSVQAPRSLPAYICYIWCQIDRNMMNVNRGAKKRFWQTAVINYSTGFSKKAPVCEQKMKFYIKDFFSECDQIRRKLRIWSHSLKKSLMENFIFCVVSDKNS